MLKAAIRPALEVSKVKVKDVKDLHNNLTSCLFTGGG